MDILSTWKRSQSALAHGCEDARMRINKHLNSGTHRCLDLARQLPKAPVGSLRGFMAEFHHEATFNANAVTAGAPQRAAVVPGNQPADIRILKGQEVVQRAQLKMRQQRHNLRKSLNDPRYDGMQKVGLKGVTIEGVADHISAGGVRSEPLSAEQGNKLVQNPAAHFDQYRPSVAKLAARAGAWGAGTGAVLGAGMALGSSFWTKGRCDEEDVAGVVEGAVWGVATGALAGFVSVLARSTAAGSAAAGVLGVWGAARECTDEREAVHKAVVSFASIAGGVCAASLCVRSLSPAAAAVVGPLAALCVSGWVLRGVGGGDAGADSARGNGAAWASCLRFEVW